jgi:osmoprotectant transport system ATP-binding protein
MPVVEFRDVGYQLGGTAILSHLSLCVEAGETLVFLGRSGSGKTTVLKMINGLLFPTSGEVLVEGRSTLEWDPIRLRRRIGYVIQEIGLFPHFTVARNVGLVPSLEAWSPTDIERRVDELLRKVGLPPAEFRARYPRQLSGGQRQRVGVARALAAKPALLLFDEPFGALDPVTRRELQQQFLALNREFRTTSVFVTHDIREALRLGARIAMMAGGQLETVVSSEHFRSAQTTEARAFLKDLED